MAGKRGPRQRSRHAVARGYPPPAAIGAAALCPGTGADPPRQARGGTPALAEALAAEPDNPRYPYVLAVAWHETGQPDKAIETLRALLARRPAERAARLALADYLQQAGDAAGADAVLVELRAINPDDPLFR
ncbi:tetratricopeptide repeat protein [Pseudomonas aeruginosa]|nr:tetratricopeptide repeat protein [Pseudomonas aeruginosa]